MSHIAELITHRKKPFYSVEFFPPKEPAQWENFFGVVEKFKAIEPLFASVTYGAGGGTQDNTVEVVRILKHEMDIEPMAHLTCIGATHAALSDVLDKLAAHGVQNVLALRGDIPKGQEIDWKNANFKYAADLVRFVRREYPRFCVGVAGYPEAHPESPSFSSDLRYTKTKVDAGSQFIVTQLFFDVREYVRYVDQLQHMGVRVPIIPGVLPIQSFAALKRILPLCGANIPAKLYTTLETAHEKGGSEAVQEAGLRFAVQQIKDLFSAGAPGIHLYTLNKAELCLEIVAAVGVK